MVALEQERAALRERASQGRGDMTQVGHQPDAIPAAIVDHDGDLRGVVRDGGGLHGERADLETRA